MFKRKENSGSLIKSNVCAEENKRTIQQMMNNFLPACVCAMQQQKVNTKASPNLLENVLDISSTIAQILTICGVDSQKANQAVASITQAFLHFDENFKHQTTNTSCKSRHLRKEDLFENLRKDCCMSEEEAKLTASVAKCAFRAFYHKQSLRKYDVGYYAENDWKAAAERTINAYAKAGATKSELEIANRRIHNAYKGYIKRIATKVPYADDSQRPSMKPGCMSCSQKNNHSTIYSRPDATQISGTSYQQVTCTCCGCLKQHPASYRDSKGRSILFLDNNDLYYNFQPMRQEVNNIRKSFAEKLPDCNEAFFDIDADVNSLPRALYDLTHDIVEKAIKGRPIGPRCEDDKHTEDCSQSMDESARERLSMQKRRINQSNKLNQPAKCDCRGRGDEYENFRDPYRHQDHSGKRRDTYTPANSLDGTADEVLQIEFRGLCHKTESGRANVDLLGLKLINDNCEATDFICKRRVQLVNRYTQTGGSAGPSPRLSKINTQYGRKPSASSFKSRSSKESLKRQPHASERKHQTSSELGLPDHDAGGSFGSQHAHREDGHGHHDHGHHHHEHDHDQDRDHHDYEHELNAEQLERHTNDAEDNQHLSLEHQADLPLSKLSNKLHVRHSENLDVERQGSTGFIQVLHRRESHNNFVSRTSSGVPAQQSESEYLELTATSKHLSEIAVAHPEISKTHQSDGEGDHAPNASNETTPPLEKPAEN